MFTVNSSVSRMFLAVLCSRLQPMPMMGGLKANMDIRLLGATFSTPSSFTVVTRTT